MILLHLNFVMVIGADCSLLMWLIAYAQELIEHDGPHSRKTNQPILWNFGYATVKAGMATFSPGGVDDKSEQEKKKLVAMVFAVLVEYADKVGFIWAKDKDHPLTRCELHPIADFERIKAKREEAEAKQHAKRK